MQDVQIINILYSKSNVDTTISFCWDKFGP